MLWPDPCLICPPPPRRDIKLLYSTVYWKDFLLLDCFGAFVKHQTTSYLNLFYNHINCFYSYVLLTFSHISLGLDMFSSWENQDSELFRSLSRTQSQGLEHKLLLNHKRVNILNLFYPVEILLNEHIFISTLAVFLDSQPNTCLSCRLVYVQKQSLYYAPLVWKSEQLQCLLPQTG